MSSTAGEPGNLTRLRDIYNRHMERIETEYRTAMADWPTRYLQDLDSLATRFQQAGDLMGWQTIDTESKRFRDTDIIPDQSPAGTPAILQDLHDRYRQLLQQTELTRARQLVDLTSMYLERLETLQTGATRAGNMPEALAYHRELSIVKALPKYSVAQQTIEKHRAPPEDDEDEEAAPSTQSADREQTPDLRLPDGVKITQGVSAPTIAGLTFTPHRLTPADRSHLLRNISANCWNAVTSEISRSTSSYYFHRYSSRSGQSHHFFRLALRSASTDKTHEAARILIQVYGRDLSDRTAAPSLLDSKFFTLPLLDANRSVFIDLPPVSLRSFSSSSTHAGTTRRGLDFFGIAVSVFDSDSELLYQAVSTPALNPLTPESLPPDFAEEHDRLSAHLRHQAARRNLEAARATMHSGPQGMQAYEEAYREMNETRAAMWELQRH